MYIYWLLRSLPQANLGSTVRVRERQTDRKNNRLIKRETKIETERKETETQSDKRLNETDIQTEKQRQRHR